MFIHILRTEAGLVSAAITNRLLATFAAGKHLYVHHLVRERLQLGGRRRRNEKESVSERVYLRIVVSSRIKDQIAWTHLLEGEFIWAEIELVSLEDQSKTIRISLPSKRERDIYVHSSVYLIPPAERESEVFAKIIDNLTDKTTAVEVERRFMVRFTF